MEEGNSTPKRTSVAERATDWEKAAVVPLTNNPVTVTPSSRTVSKSFRACSISEAEAKTANGEVVEPPKDKVKVPLKPDEVDVSRSVDFSQTSCFSPAPVVDEAIPHSVNSDGGAIVGAGVSTQDVPSPFATPHASKQDVPLPPSTPQTSNGFVTSIPRTGTPTSSWPLSAFSSNVLTAFMSSSKLLVDEFVVFDVSCKRLPPVMLQKGPP
mmetsp:Transcript_7945/g.21180  ORF Transcript_7945/g.21180 Transcript_7945/m.21180 type:complete len:211 (+) Transcript_7945:2627-3259(+)